MQIDDAISRHEAVDAALEEAAGYDLPVKIRVQPQVLTRRDPLVATRTYLAWRGVYWNIACDSVGEALLFRRTIGLFFELLAKVGLNQVYAVLDKLRQPPVESPPVDA